MKNKNAERRLGKKRLISLFEITLMIGLTIAISVMMSGGVDAAYDSNSRVFYKGTAYSYSGNGVWANGRGEKISTSQFTELNIDPNSVYDVSSSSNSVGTNTGAVTTNDNFDFTKLTGFGSLYSTAQGITNKKSPEAPSEKQNTPSSLSLPNAASKIPTESYYMTGTDGQSYFYKYDAGSKSFKFNAPADNPGVMAEEAGLQSSYPDVQKDASFLSTSDKYVDDHPIKSLYGGQYGNSGSRLASMGGSLLAGLSWAATAYAATYLITSMFDVDANLAESIQYSVTAGAFVAGTMNSMIDKGIISQGTSKVWAGIGGLAAAALVFVLTYKETSSKAATFTCDVWEAPSGGKDCEQCNKDVFRPCDEYRCKALGQSCELLNAGTGQEKCAWVNPKDVSSPIITPLESALTSGLKYSGDGTRPTNKGIKIINESNTDGCLGAFTKLQFGVNLSEPAKCRADFTRSSKAGVDGFNQLTYEFGAEQYFLYNHTQLMVLPNGNSTNTTGSMVFTNGNTVNVYTKCMDSNGNVNDDDYVFTFCVKKGPDTTPPIIEGFSIIDGSYVQYNIDQTPIDVYTNEPAKCKWSRVDQDYSEMENNMSCATKTSQINSKLTYTCSGNLTGVADMQDNKYYFNCKDYPDDSGAGNNEMSVNKVLTLKGSQPLVIDKVGPNGTVSGSTTTVNVTLFVKTSAGAEEGKAVCSISDTGEKDSFVAMGNTDSYESSQYLDLTAGAYGYYVRCIDAGGNLAESNATFIVDVDTVAPTVTRAYKEGDDALKIVTSEDANCVYSLTSCSYEFSAGITDVIKPDVNIGNVLLIKWETGRVYYIKCGDLFGNNPAPNECSIIASPSKF